MKRLTKFFDLINNHTIRIILYCFIIFFVFSIFLSFSNKHVKSNLNINGLSFLLDSNSDMDDKRILRLESNKIDVFDITLFNLNDINTKYEILFELCNNADCSNTSKEIPSDLLVYKESDSTNISGKLESKKSNNMRIITKNNSDTVYYIKISLNAVYEDDNLYLSNQISDVYQNDVDIIAYVDGIERDDFPSTCNYYVETKSYVNNTEVKLDDFSITCDRKTNKWVTEYTGFVDRIELKFIYLSFTEDSWDKIANIVKNGMMSGYPIGAEKEVEIEGKNYTVRVANNTTPDECGQTNFSQTACGFVVEFVDIVDSKSMNSSQNTSGGWPASEMYTYANDDFFNKLPSELQNVIISTTVISGHGAFAGQENYSSRDKIYLLSGHEVFNNNTSNDITRYDSAYNNTRQLDYYASLGITSSNGNLPVKNYNDSKSSWWLRTAITNTSGNFMTASEHGVSQIGASMKYGFAPAFRIGVQSTTFAEDSWDTIANAVKAGQMTDYSIGSEKEVNIDGVDYTLRVSNNSAPSECYKSNFSETACGFVVEFVDIVEKRVMNSTATNVGGWPASELRTYVNGDFFDKLPKELKNVIINTKVISGYGSDDSTNFISIDKIYLLGAHEVWTNGINNRITYDSAYNNTRQLDYYVFLNVTTDKYSDIFKTFNGEAYCWWLRTANLNQNSNYFLSEANGDFEIYPSTALCGFAPAFRIGR